MSRATHVATFVAGAAAACAISAHTEPRDVIRFRTLDTFAQALATVQQSYVDPVDEQRLIYDAARGMLHNLDAYSTFLPPNRYKRLRQDTEGEFGGVGVVLAPGTIDDTRPGQPPYPTIDELVPRSPADMAGLQLDDRVVSIDGAPTAEGGRELANASTWEARMRGASGTRLELGVVRAGWKEPRTFTLVRAQVKQPSVRHRVLAPRIGYLKISRFAEATSGDAAAALAELGRQRALDVLVLDLRADPGGLVDQAVAVADLFLDEGTIVTIRGRTGVEHQPAHPGGPAVGVPVIALVDHGTASAAEILAAALRDHGRARLVGETTYGKGTVQTFFDLSDGAGLKLTTARYYTPNGKSLESKGLVPDVAVDAFAGEEIVAGTPATNDPGSGADVDSDATIDRADDDDPQLQAAVKLARKALQDGKK